MVGTPLMFMMYWEPIVFMLYMYGVEFSTLTISV